MGKLLIVVSTERFRKYYNEYDL